jgi:hypothetical protein
MYYWEEVPHRLFGFSGAEHVESITPSYTLLTIISQNCCPVIPGSRLSNSMIVESVNNIFKVYMFCFSISYESFEAHKLLSKSINIYFFKTL